MSYEEFAAEEEVKTVPAYNENDNNYYNLVDDLESGDEVEENLFDKQMEIKSK